MNILFLPNEIKLIIAEASIEPLQERATLEPAKDIAIKEGSQPCFPALEKAHKLAESLYHFQKLSTISTGFYDDFHPTVKKLADKITAAINEVPYKWLMISTSLSRGSYLKTLLAYFYFSPSILQKEGAEWIQHAAQSNPRGSRPFIRSLLRAESAYHLQISHEPTVLSLEKMKTLLEEEMAASNNSHEKERLRQSIVAYAKIQDLLWANVPQPKIKDCRIAQQRTPNSLLAYGIKPLSTPIPSKTKERSSPRLGSGW